MSGSSDERYQQLHDAFDTFNEFAESLSSTYRALESRVSKLNQELIDTRSARYQQLIENERLASRLSNLVQAMPAALIVIDGNGVIQESNLAAEQLLQTTVQFRLWREVIEECFEAETEALGDVSLKNGRIVTLSTCPLGTEPGQVIVLMDVTESRAMQQNLERYKRLSAMGEVMAKLAHQIRTPLSSALLYSSQLRNLHLQDSMREKFTEKLVHRLQHLEQVVNDMLAFTRGGSGDRQDFDLSDMLGEVQQITESILESQGCRLYVQNADDSYPLYGNQTALVSVIQNLISNAAQACGEGGIIWLSSREVDKHQGIPSVDIVVKDNGPGIPVEFREKVFEPFFTRRDQGTGLGLAIAQAVIQANGGNIWIEKTGKEGTTFVIRLPLRQNEQVVSNCLKQTLESISE